MRHLVHTPLAFAITALLGANATAQTTEVDLGILPVTTYQGGKITTNVITTQLQNERTDTDLRGLLREEPAIAIGGGNGTSQFFYIRGVGQNAIDLKVDNAYSDSQIHYHQGRFMLDPALVKVVSVQKGAGAASAGIGATNGAIVAKTLDAGELLKDSDQPYGVKVRAGYNSNDGHSYGASVFGQFDNVDVLASYNRINDNAYKGGSGYKNLAGSSTVTNSALDKQSYLVKGGINVANHRFVLSHLKEAHEGNRPVREEFDFANTPLTVGALSDLPKSLTEEQLALGLGGYKLGEVANPDEVTQGKKTSYYVIDPQGNTTANLKRNQGSNKKMHKGITNLEWTATDLGFAESATANVYKVTYGREAANDSNNGYAGNIDGSTRMHIDTVGANLNFDSNVADNVLVKYGINYRKQEVVPAQFFATYQDRQSRQTITNPPLVNQQKTDTGIYAEAISDWGALTATTGLRLDRFSIRAMDGKTIAKNELNPSIGLVYQLSPALRISGNLSYASRSPRLYDAITAGGNRGVVTMTDDLKAEKARNSEIGFDYKAGNFSANGNYFWQRTNNAIGNFATARHGVRITEMKNVGHMTNQGYELGVAYHQGNLTARAGVADSKPVMVGDGLSQNPEFATKIGRTWTGSIAYRLDHPNLEIGVRNRTAQGVNSVLLKGQTPQNKDGYSVSDVFANYKPLGNDKLNLNFAINNVFDKHYRPHAQRPAVTTLVGAGRDFRLGINYTY